MIFKTVAVDLYIDGQKGTIPADKVSGSHTFSVTVKPNMSVIDKIMILETVQNMGTFIIKSTDYSTGDKMLACEDCDSTTTTDPADKVYTYTAPYSDFKPSGNYVAHVEYGATELSKSNIIVIEGTSASAAVSNSASAVSNSGASASCTAPSIAPSTSCNRLCQGSSYKWDSEDKCPDDAETFLGFTGSEVTCNKKEGASTLYKSALAYTSGTNYDWRNSLLNCDDNNFVLETT